MPSNRIVYQDWIVELGRDPGRVLAAEDGEGNRAIIEAAVESAIRKLTEDEREFIQRFYYMGQTYREISESSGRALYRLEALHRRAVRRLRKELAPLVAELYGLENKKRPDCVICRSEHCEKINRLISARKESETWRPVIRRIRERFGLKITTPQTLIGHQKYHGGRLVARTNRKGKADA